MPRKHSKLGDGSHSKQPRAPCKRPSSLKPRSAYPSAKNSHQSPSDERAMCVGPSTKSPHNTPSDGSPSVPRSTGREFPNGALSAVIESLPGIIGDLQGLDNGDDTHFDITLNRLFYATAATKFTQRGPQSLLEDQAQFRKNVNVAKSSDPDFIKLLRQAVMDTDNNEELWGHILMHGMSPELL